PTSVSSVSPECQDFDVRHIGSFHYDDLDPGYIEAKARVSVMDDEGILAAGLYPQVDFPSYAGVHLLRSDDAELANVCARAYNDFVLEEWADAVPGRFIPLMVLPLGDPVAAAAEIRRAAALGAKGITFPEDPVKLGLPSINVDAWDPVFDAAQETGLPLCIHNASSLWMPPIGRDTSMLVPAVMLASMATMTFFDWIFSNVFVRFPSLRIVQNECDVGWIPWALQRCDVQWERNRVYRAAWNSAPPSGLFGSNMFACVLPYETDTAEAVAQIGADGLLMETDYPHLDMSFPHTQSMVRQNLGALSDADLAKVLRGNAAQLFNLAL
ncbi:MAG TPA: amidohydrolase family protein, partial [Pseudonocardia sp.]